MSSNLNSLEELETFGVSLVHRGANKKRFAFFKSEGMVGMMEENEILEAVIKTPVGDEQKLEAVLKEREMSSKAKSAFKGMLRIANAFKEELPEDMLEILAQMSGKVAPKRKKDDDKEKEMEEKAKAKKATKKAEQMDAEKVETKKALDDMPAEMKAQVEELWKKNAEAVKKAQELEAVLKSERDERRKKDFIEKAAKEYAHVPGEANAIGNVIKSAYDASHELGAAIEEILSNAEQIIKKSKAFDELGSAAAWEETGAWGKIQKAAKELTSKSGDKMSESQAIDYIMRQEPGLYNEYLAETQAQTGRRV